MSNEGDKATVFRTTKVRTKLRGDNSWLQRRSEPPPETQSEKPWIAEVKASRLNEANVESSPVSAPTESSPVSLKTSTERSPSSGFMIRGVFTKTEKTPPTSNGYSAPHIIRNTENQEEQLSPVEQEKRTEAASNVLKKSAAKQRSYVLSAAKLYESKDKTPDLLVNSTSSFVAQRVEVADDEESNASTSPTTTTTTVPNLTPLPKPRTLANTSSKPIEPKEETKPVEEKIEEKTPEKEPSEDLVPGCTKVATPLPELITDLVQAVYVKSDDSADAEQPESPVVEAAPTTPVPDTPPYQTVTVESVVIVTEEAVKAEPEQDDVGRVEMSSDSIPVCDPDTSPERFIDEEPLPLVELEPHKSLEVEAESESQFEEKVDVSPEPQPEPELDVVQIEITQMTVKEEEPEQPVEVVEVPKEAEPEMQIEVEDEQVQDLVEIEHIQTILKNEEPSFEEKTDNSVPPVSVLEPLTDDLLGFNDSSPQLVEPVSPSIGQWSQDLLTPVESEKPEPEKTSNFVDLLSNEDIVITQVHSLSMSPDVEEEKPPATEAQSTNTVIITDESEAESADLRSSCVITTVTESSSTDPFDPYPIGTTSSNSSSDLLQPLPDISINSALSTSAENKETDPETHLRTDRSWARTWEAPQRECVDESHEAPAAAGGGQDGDQQTVIKFELKSKEIDSPWDKWMSPTVYTFCNEDEEEESAKNVEIETQVITTVTTIRETHNEPEPSMESTQQEQDSKKPFVYVKEYVNSTEQSLHNARDIDSSDYFTSTSTGYSYSRPSTYSSGSLSSNCTFCGEPVGNDAKITIEHLNINCHPECFKCGGCGEPMGDLLHKMFLHGGKVHCGTCYQKALDSL